MMKILILVPTFKKSSPVNGAFLLAKYLHEKGKDVVFISLDDKHRLPKLIDGLTDTGMNFYYMGSRGWIDLVGARRRIQQYVKKNGVDLVIAYELRPTLITSTLRDVVRMASLRGMIRDSYPLYYRYGRLVISVFLSAQLMALKRMDRVISMTQDMTDWLVSEGVERQKISVINNFVDVTSIRRVGRESANKRRKNTTNIGVFCNFVPLKGVDVVLKAFKKVVSEYKDEAVHLHLVGDGPIRMEMENLAKELKIDHFCSFYGFVENPLPLMNEMDLVLLASTAEGVPRCLMEALSLGKTVIASNILGTRDLIIDRRTGFLFRAGDVNGLAGLINSVVGNKLFLTSEKLVDFMFKNHDVKGCGHIFWDEMVKTHESKRHKNKFVASVGH